MASEESVSDSQYTKQQNVQVTINNVPEQPKSVIDAYLLSVPPLGLLGFHHFYLKRPGWGVLYFFTLGFIGLGLLIDWIRMPCLVKESNRKINEGGSQVKSLSDAYILWIPPFGLLGFHNFYLGSPGWGVLYMLTLGLLSKGWLVDGVRMYLLVSAANRDLQQASSEPTKTPLKRADDTFVLVISPFGLLGFHHYYLGNGGMGILYTFTLGLLGVGWVWDWFRFPLLTERANRKIQMGDDGKKYLDQAYVFWFPFGFFGFHHFYLGRPGWGFLYLLTLGVFGIGWLIDLFRMPCLVRQANETIIQRQVLVDSAHQNAGPNSHLAVPVDGGYTNPTGPTQIPSVTDPKMWNHPYGAPPPYQAVEQTTPVPPIYSTNQQIRF